MGRPIGGFSGQETNNENLNRGVNWGVTHQMGRIWVDSNLNYSQNPKEPD